MQSLGEYQKVLQSHRICDASKASMLWNDLAVSAVAQAGWMALQLVEQASDFTLLLPDGETKIQTMKQLASIAWAKGELDMALPLTESRGNLLLNKLLLFSGEHWAEGGAVDALLQNAVAVSKKAAQAAILDSREGKPDFDVVLSAATQAAWASIRAEWTRGLLHTEEIEQAKNTVKNAQQEGEADWRKWMKTPKQQKTPLSEKVQEGEKKVETLKKNVLTLFAEEAVTSEKHSKEIWATVLDTGLTKENKAMSFLFWDTLQKNGEEAQEYLKKIKTMATQEIQNDTAEQTVVAETKKSNPARMRR